MSRFLDKNGLSRVWNRMKDYVDGHVFTPNNILAGDNITILRENGNATISATASGGGSSQEFKILNFTVSNVNATSEKMYILTDTMLSQQGIADMFDYEVVAISAKPTDRLSRVYTTHDVDASGRFTLPSIVYTRTGEAGVTQGFQVSVYNVYDTAKSFDVRVVLMKVA